MELLKALQSLEGVDGLEIDIEDYFIEVWYKDTFEKKIIIDLIGYDGYSKELDITDLLNVQIEDLTFMNNYDNVQMLWPNFDELKAFILDRIDVKEGV